MVHQPHLSKFFPLCKEFFLVFFLAPSTNIHKSAQTKKGFPYKHYRDTLSTNTTTKNLNEYLNNEVDKVLHVYVDLRREPTPACEKNFP